MAMASSGLPSASRKITPRCSACVSAEISAPSRNKAGRDDGAEAAAEEAFVVAAGDCARVGLESMRQTSETMAIVRMCVNQPPRWRRRWTNAIAASVMPAPIDAGSGIETVYVETRLPLLYGVPFHGSATVRAGLLDASYADCPPGLP